MNNNLQNIIAHSSYFADEQIATRYGIQNALCVLFPHALLYGGFGDYGQPMILHHYYNKEDPSPWPLHFFEQIFMDEPSLSDRQKMLSVFIASEKTLLVPEKIYSADEAEKWISQIHFIEKDERIKTYSISGKKYLYTVPVVIKDMLKRQLGNVKLQPLTAYQFKNPPRDGSLLQCCVSENRVHASLFIHGLLHWHQCFEYEKAEDIAYCFHLLCKEKNLDAAGVNVKCYVTTPQLLPVLHSLTEYFPGMDQYDLAEEQKNNLWSSTISLVQQLYSCAL